MTTPNVTTNRQQDILGKLLATEDIRIVRRPAATASFNVVDRVLTLPTWQGVSKDVIDLFIGHEVSHALYTPTDDWMRAVKHSAGFQQFLNIVEDARIEKKIKRLYPGLRKPMFDGYNELVQRDFFGAKYGDFQKLLFIDRLNVHFKVGSRAGITFSEAEQAFVDRVEACETWSEVEALSHELWVFCEEERKALREQAEQDATAPKKLVVKKSNKPKTKEQKEKEDKMDLNDYDEVEFDDSEDDDESDEDEDEDEEGMGEEKESDKDKENEKGEKGEQGGKGEKGEQSDDSDDADGEGDDDDEDEESDEEGEGVSEQSGKGAGRSNGAEADDESKIERQIREQLESDEGFSLTEEAVKRAQEKLVDFNYEPPTFAVTPRLNIRDFIIPAKDMYSVFDKARALPLTAGRREARYERFMKANKNYVNLLAQGFEMKRMAKRLTGARVAKSGKIDIDRVHRYKFAEDLFSSTTILPEGKNHGMLMVVDMSVSMVDVMAKTMEQAVILAMFCRKVNIPFTVYGFSDNGESGKGAAMHPIFEQNRLKNRNDKAPAALIINDKGFHFKELLTSSMRAPIFTSAVKDILMRGQLWGGGYDADVNYGGGARWALSGTPLLDSFILLRQVAEDFRRQTGCEILNTILLSDGDGAGSLDTKEDNPSVKAYTHVVTDRDTKATVDTTRYGNWNDPQAAMMDMYRKATGSRLMVLYLAKNKGDMQSRLVTRHALRDGETFDSKIKNEWAKDGFVSMDTLYSDSYFIVDAREMSAEEVSMDSTLRQSKNKSLFRAFRDMQDKKAVSRVFVNRFIASIA
jgi:hypothetical protein